MEIIDQLIYINLDKRPDRREAIESEFSRMGFPPSKITRIPAVSNPTNGIGCHQSHIAALKEMRDRGYKTAWIFEDDFQFTATQQQLESSLKQLFSKKPAVDVALCAYIHKQTPIPPLATVAAKFPNIYRVVESQTASSYIVRDHYVKQLIDLFEDALIQLEQTGAHWLYANDQVWKLLQRRDVWYCITPSVGQQRADVRDNSDNAPQYAVCYSDQG
jgi:hypothetical protein